MSFHALPFADRETKVTFKSQIHKIKFSVLYVQLFNSQDDVRLLLVLMLTFDFEKQLVAHFRGMSSQMNQTLHKEIITTPLWSLPIYCKSGGFCALSVSLFQMKVTALGTMLCFDQLKKRMEMKENTIHLE